MRNEVLGAHEVISTWDSPRLGGWPDALTASAALRKKAAWLKPVPLICGGYETQIPHPSTGLRERITFWPDQSA